MLIPSILFSLLCLLSTVYGTPTVRADGDPASDNQASNVTQKLLYILLDGCRFDYVSEMPEDELPGFTEFLKNGVQAKYVIPLYPTFSYPTWTTLVTGLYAENHGVIGNYFIDPEEKDKFSLFDSDSTVKPKWWKAEPIWTTATKQNKTTAVYLWSRCDVKIDDVVPAHCEKFEKITGPEIFRTNIEKALGNFAEGYDFVQVYTEHLDNIGHINGPDSDERKNATKEIDATLVYLQEEIKTRNLENQLNVVIVSDHGMTSVSSDDATRVNIDEFLPDDITLITSIAGKGSFVYINVKRDSDEALETVFEALSEMSGVQVYKKADIPEKWNLGKAEYMSDIVVVAKLNNLITPSAREYQFPTRTEVEGNGAHGYDATEEKMRAIFYAKGPAFKKNVVINPINIVDIYQVVAKVLNITALPNNGTFKNVKNAFALAAPGPLLAGILLPMMVLMPLWNTFKSPF